MRVTDGGRRSTLTGEARRAQIVAAAIDTIAELGYRQASFARIAERAGLSSTRLISYHFAGKDELMRQVVLAVVGDIGRHVTERLRREPTAAGALRAYIRAVIGYNADNRPRMAALMEIFLNHRDESGEGSYDAGDDADVLNGVEEILRRGQRAGEFRAFDTRVMAFAIQRSLDGLPFLLQAEPGRDIGAYAEELVTTFDLATRAEP
ncbi:TetR family transcriptional regulator [Sphaerisporangium rufum]|uniref:TetR family transcriptional regulator n=1 Tax=Sphaerisporangium rufum TaxID=1381558 RepID=A0A919V0E8_9ACTN|nr:TetR/AcrR family transcriptional regulator [Sphaerisporangium rufum]GII76618.1 TetR family transcriptional regulator [Sphaerisporangium rufum]